MEVFTIEFKNGNTKNLEIINVIISSLVILLLSSIMPILIFLLPGPSIALSVKNGQKYGLISIMAIAIAMIFIMDIRIAITFSLYILPMVSIMSMMIRHKENLNKIIIYNFIAFLFISLIGYLNLRYILKIDIINAIINYFNDITVNVIKIMEKSDLDYLKSNVEFFKTSIQIVKINLPALSMIVALSFILISLIYAMNSLRKRGIIYNQKFRFIHFRIGGKLIIPIAILSILLYLAGYYNLPYFNILLSNFITFFSFIFVMAGISTVDYYFIGKLPKILRVFIPIIVLFFARGDLLFLGIGFIDMLVNFRKRFSRLENDEF